MPRPSVRADVHIPADAWVRVATHASETGPTVSVDMGAITLYLRDPAAARHMCSIFRDVEMRLKDTA